jgi:hypothetical protein
MQPHLDILRQALIPGPAHILGLPMKPYSIGHELLIQTEPENKSIEQSLARACVICSNTWEENRNLDRDILILFKFWIWKKRVRRNKWNADLESLKFAAYRANGSLAFPISDRVDPSRERGPTPGTPFLLQLHQFMVIHFRLKEHEAWDYPYGMAILNWTCYWEQQGKMRVKNAQEIEFEKFIAEQEAEGRKQCQD